MKKTSIAILIFLTIVSGSVATCAFTLAQLKSGHYLHPCWNRGSGEHSHLYGFIDRSGKWVITPKYIHAEEFSDGLAMVEYFEDGVTHSSYVNANGRVAIEGPFESAEKFNGGHATVCINGEAYTLSSDGSLEAHLLDGHTPVRSEFPLLYRRPDQWGVKGPGGQVVWTKAITTVGAFVNGLAPALDKKAQRYGFIKANGDWAISPKFVNTEEFQEGLARVMIESDDRAVRYGFVDRTGKYVIAPRLDSAGWFSEGLAAARKPGGLYGFIDAKGRWVIEPKFEICSPFADGFAGVTLAEKDENGRTVCGEHKFVDHQGRLFDPEVIADRRRKAQPGAIEGALRTNPVDGKVGFVNASGTTVIPPRFEHACEFKEGYARVMTNGKWGFIDRSGKTVVPRQLNEACDFSEGVAAVKLQSFFGLGRWGYIDTGGVLKIKDEYDLAQPFSEGVAYVAKCDTAEFVKGACLIDRDGKRVANIPSSVCYVGKFCGGLAPASIAVPNN